MRRKHSILLVEDNPGDVTLVKEAFKGNPYIGEMITMLDGEKAVDHLKQAVETAYALPDLIILDLNLPRKNGAEVLAEIKSDIRLKLIPIIILTSSEANHDIMRSYRLHANCYITKPVDFNELADVLNGAIKFWFSVAQLPTE